MNSFQSIEEQANSLPDFLRPYFWDVDLASVRLPKHEVYVIERVLEYGDDQAIRWLNRFSPDTITNVVRRSRRISRNTANLWALVLNIPKEQIRCLKAPSLLMPGNS
ncbi:MAG: DUF6922 domain-containing protein [Ardenticatenaceae bacterium]